jgi:DNA end-binding protein Ku
VIAEAIIKRRTGTFDPATFRDRYQEALKELIEAKMKGLPVKAKPPERSRTSRRSDGGAEAQPCAGKRRA